MSFFDVLNLYVELNLITVIVVFGVLFFLRKNSEKYRDITVCIQWNLLIALLLSIVDTLELWTSSFPTPSIWRVVFSFVGYSLRPIAILLIIWSLEKEKKKRALFSIPALLNILICSSAFFSGIVFSYDEHNSFVRGPLGFTAHFVYFLYLIIFIVLIFKKFDKKARKERNLLLFIIASVTVVIVLESALSISGKLNTIIAVSCMFYYMYYYAKSSAEEATELRMEQEQKIALEHIAYTDPLTRLGNRTAFSKALENCGENEKIAYVAADINNLKMCNDRYGHLEGDKLIQDAAECMREAFDGLGSCFRIGGDETCVLLRDKDETEILQALDKMNRLIEEKNKSRKMPLSVASGYAVRRENESTEKLLNRSDEMMYEVKHRMKKTSPIYSEEQIKTYLNVLQILNSSTDSYLYLWIIGKDEILFFGDVNRNYALSEDGKTTVTTAEMERIVYPADRRALREDLQKIADGTKRVHDMNYRWVNRRGETVWISCRGKTIEDDKGKPFVMIGRVSDTALRYLYNPLTKLFNKTRMLTELKEEILPLNEGYFMLVDVDNLGNVNLKYGRDYGDQLLITCAKVLEEVARPQKLYHVENNCFGLYLNVKTEQEVYGIYFEIQKKLADKCTVSAGVVPNNAEIFEDSDRLYDFAGQTLTKAKKSGKNTVVFFSRDDLKEKIQNIRLLEELQESVENGFDGFYLCYQPQVRAGNYRLYGAEALLRYRSATRGNVYPDEFIPLLEQSNLIKQVGMWTLETALTQCRRWRESAADFHINVNFSAVQLKEENIAEKVIGVLKKTGMPGNALTIEVTESMQVQEIKHFGNAFKRWKEVGIEISLDDFGTGYSSLSYLKKLDVNEIKIDKLFVRGIEETTYNYRLIGNIIEFAKNNSIRTCCEGVESMRELAVLEGLSPDLIQGYLFSKPYKAEQFERSFIDKDSEAYKENEEFIRKIYRYKDERHVIYFNEKDILRKTNLGLWIIRLDESKNHYEMHADETMERVMTVDKKYTPQECYDHWYSRIKEGYVDYVNKNVKRMIESGKVVQLQYPWIHPVFGEVMVRCNGIRVEDSDGMITLEGYHRIISTIEGVDSES